MLHVWLYGSPSRSRVDVGPLDAVLPDLAFGVTLFFALSGFLLYRPFAAAVVRGEPLPSIGRYLRNRALRILPAYWVILLLVAVVLQSFIVREGSQLHTGGFDGELFARNALLVQDAVPGTIVTGIGPAWSLAIEAVFYVLLPLLALGAWRLALGRPSRGARRIAALVPALGLLLVGLCAKFAAGRILPPVSPYNGWNNDWHSVLERSFLCHADLFAFGMALAVVRVDWEDSAGRFPRGWRKPALALALGGYLLTAAKTHIDEQLSYSIYNTIMAAVCALLLALVVLPRHDRAGLSLPMRVLESRLFVSAGLISYSLFLWHEPLIHFLQEHDLTFAGRAGFFANVAVVAALGGALSYATYRLVEVPALRLKRRKGARAARTTPELPPARAEAL